MQRPAWVPAASAALGLAALLSLAYAVAWWAALVGVLLWAFALGRGHLGLSPGGRLSFLSGDAWLFEHDGACHKLTLLHVWYGPAWTTLRFRSSGRSLELTVWRSTVSSAGWRNLRQLASRGRSGPRLRVTEV